MTRSASSPASALAARSRSTSACSPSTCRPCNRGRWLVILESFWGVGHSSSPPGLALDPRPDARPGRYLLGSSAVAGALVFWVRLRIPESPRFLAATGRGRPGRGDPRPRSRARTACRNSDVPAHRRPARRRERQGRTNQAPRSRASSAPHHGDAAEHLVLHRRSPPYDPPPRAGCRRSSPSVASTTVRDPTATRRCSLAAQSARLTSRPPGWSSAGDASGRSSPTCRSRAAPAHVRLRHGDEPHGADRRGAPARRASSRSAPGRACTPSTPAAAADNARAPTGMGAASGGSPAWPASSLPLNRRRADPGLRPGLTLTVYALAFALAALSVAVLGHETRAEALADTVAEEVGRAPSDRGEPLRPHDRSPRSAPTHRRPGLSELTWAGVRGRSAAIASTTLRKPATPSCSPEYRCRPLVARHPEHRKAYGPTLKNARRNAWLPAGLPGAVEHVRRIRLGVGRRSSPVTTPALTSACTVTRPRASLST